MSAKLHLVLALCVVSAAPAGARTIVYGSSLRAKPDIAEAHQADSAFWPAARGLRAPATGQIERIRLKGTVVPSADPLAPPPLNQVHFQHLRPLSGGRMLALQSTAPFYVPVGGNRNAISTYRPENLCVNRGDVIDFNDEGGWVPGFYQGGVPFRVFASTRHARTARYTADQRTNNGDRFTPTVRRSEELLLQLVLVTGRGVSYACRDFNRQQRP
jgi:hypothetical protein